MQSQDSIQPDAHAYGAVMACLAKANMVQETLTLLGVSTAIVLLLSLSDTICNTSCCETEFTGL
jgi:hypothetical protein